MIDDLLRLGPVALGKVQTEPGEPVLPADAVDFVLDRPRLGETAVVDQR